MKKITEFIKHYQFKKSYEFQVKSDFYNLIEIKFNLKLDLNKVKVKNNIIYLDLDSKTKTLIILNRQNILIDLNKIIPGPEIINIT